MNTKMKSAIGLSFLCLFCFALGLFSANSKPKNRITTALVAASEKIIGLRFSDKERRLMLNGLDESHGFYRKMRQVELSNEIPPAILFNPIPAGFQFETARKPFEFKPTADVKMPANRDDLAFYSIPQLANLLRTKQITSVELTAFFLERLKRYGPKLECVVTLTEDLAVEQAKQADAEMAAGKYRGLLHGIPYGAKDLLATRGIPTTWGSVPYKDQILNYDATVVTRLREAGAVLVAKLTLGELAWGDVWFGGTTKNPWNYKQGSSGSSAGSASATAAGLVPFAIGSETWGSIVSPASRCGVTGLRPSYGRVSRAGAMALSWSMDKLGPICRTVEDCAIIFQEIQGPDTADPTVYDVPFNYNPEVRLADLKIGFLRKDFEKPDDKENAGDELQVNDEATLRKLRELGASLIAIDVPPLPINELQIILSAEAAAAFDEMTRTNKDDLMKRQIEYAWPNAFRTARFIPAVEYIQANRIRYLLIQRMAEIMKQVDVYVAPSFKGDNLLLTNLTGHPSVVVPNGFKQDGTPTSVSFVGDLFAEAEVLAVAKAYQDATDFHLRHPKLQE